jgi:hypothetical protein
MKNNKTTTTRYNHETNWQDLEFEEMDWQKAEYHDFVWKDEKYGEHSVSSYQGNPFIEALPLILSNQDAYTEMKCIPDFSPNDRDLPDELRFHFIYNSNQFFKPLSVHVMLQHNISILLRSGYIGRNPMDKLYFRDTDKNLADIKGNSKRKKKLRATSPSFYIVGVSGVGKSTGIYIPFSLYPQVIQHTEYKGVPFNCLQIPWLLVNCPFDGSLAGLYLAIFQSIDELLGTEYLDLFGMKGKTTLPGMEASIRRLVRLHGIGCIVIDEIQQLSVAKGQGVTTMLNLFVNLVNKVGVPIILIGTPKAYPLLTGEFQQARRASGIGDIKWFPLEYDPKKGDSENAEWEIFVEELWKYQYVRHPVELTKEITMALHTASAGVVDFAIKTFILAQFRAIMNKSETLTADLLLSVAADSFQFAEEMLDILRNHRYEKMQDIPDLQLFDLRAHYAKMSSDITRDSYLEIIKAEKAATDTIARSQGAAIQPIGQQQSIAAVPKPRRQRPKGKKSQETMADEYPPGDLRFLLLEAGKRQASIATIFFEAGIAKDVSEFYS